MKTGLGHAAAAALICFGFYGCGSDSKQVPDVSGALGSLAPRPPPVSFTNPPSAANSSFAVSPLAIADGTSPATVTVTVRDTLGNGVSQAAVQLTASDPAAVLTPAAGVTDIHGVFTARATSLHLGPCSISASAAGLSFSAQTQFTTGPAASATSSVTLDKTSIAADGLTTAAALVQVRDAQGNPLPSVPVSLQQTGLTADPASGQTDDQGRFQSTITVTALGPQSLIAVAGPLTLSTPWIGIQPPPDAAKSTLDLPANGLHNFQAATPFTLTARDLLGRPVPDAPVQILLSGAACTVSPQSGQTDAAGVFTGTLTPAADGQVQVTAQVDQLSVPGSINFVPDTPAALAIVQAPSAPVVAGSLIPLTVEIHDASGNLVDLSGLTVTADVNGVETLAGATAASSHGVATFHQLSAQRAASDTLTARLGQLTPASVPLTVLPAAPASLSFDTQPGNLIAGSPNTAHPFFVKVLDQFSNLAGDGSTVTLTFVGAQPQGVTGASAVVSGGFAQFNGFSVGTAGTWRVQANLGALTSAASAAFGVSPGAPASLSFSGLVTDVISGQSVGSMTFTLLDAFGNTTISPGTNVTLTPGAGTVSGTLSRALVNGVAVFTGLTASGPEGTRLSFTASTGGLVPAIQTPAFNVLTTASSSLSTVQAVAPAKSIADGVQAYSIVVVAKNAAGIVLPGRTVTVTGSPTGSFTGVTDATGQATVQVTSKTAGTFQMLTTVNTLTAGVLLTPRPSISFTADPATTTIAMTVSPGTPIAASSGTFPATISLTVADKNGNVWASDSVRLISSNGQFLAGAGPASSFVVNLTTGADGKATVGFGSQVAGTLSVTASDSLAHAAGQTSVVVVGGAPTQLVLDAPPQVPALAPFGFTGRLLDQFGNASASSTGTLSLSLGANPAGDALSGDTTEPVSNGLVHFTSLQLAKPARGVQLQGTCNSCGAAQLSALSDLFTVQVPRFFAPLSFGSTPAGTAAAGASVRFDWALDSSNPLAADAQLFGPGIFGAPLPSGISEGLSRTSDNSVPFANGSPAGTVATYELRTTSNSFDGWLPNPAGPLKALPGGPFINAVAQLADGSFVTAGSANGTFVIDGITNSPSTSSNADCLFMHLSSAFQALSVQRFPGRSGASCVFNAIVPAAGASGSSYVLGAGGSTFGSQTVGGTFVVKLSASGQASWASQLGPHSTATLTPDIHTLVALSSGGVDTGAAIGGNLSSGFPFDNTARVVDFTSGGQVTKQLSMPFGGFAVAAALDANGAWSWAGYGARQIDFTQSGAAQHAISSSTFLGLATAPDGSLYAALSPAGQSVLLFTTAPAPGTAGVTATRGFATSYDGVGSVTFAGATLATDAVDPRYASATDGVVLHIPGAALAGLTAGFCGDAQAACNKLAPLPDGTVLVQGSTSAASVSFPPISIPAQDSTGGAFVARLDSSLHGIAGPLSTFISTNAVAGRAINHAPPVPVRMMTTSGGGFALYGTAFGAGTSFGLLGSRQGAGVRDSFNKGADYFALFGPDGKLRWLDSLTIATSSLGTTGESVSAWTLLPDDTMAVVSGTGSDALTTQGNLAFGSGDWDPAPVQAGVHYLWRLGGANYKTAKLTQSP